MTVEVRAEQLKTSARVTHGQLPGSYHAAVHKHTHQVFSERSASNWTSMDEETFRRLPPGLRTDVRQWLSQKRWWVVLWVIEEDPATAIVKYISKPAWKEAVDSFAREEEKQQRRDQIAACQACQKRRSMLCPWCRKPAQVDGFRGSVFCCGQIADSECDKHLPRIW